MDFQNKSFTKNPEKDKIFILTSTILLLLPAVVDSEGYAWTVQSQVPRPASDGVLQLVLVGWGDKQSL